MCMFKLYLGRILGPRDQYVDKVATLSAPLLLHFEQPQSQVDKVLMATPDLGSPAPYIPIFYQQCSSITPRANHEVSVCVCVHTCCACMGTHMYVDVERELHVHIYTENYIATSTSPEVDHTTHGDFHGI